MGRRFNVTGTCIPEKHYMADISGKMEQIIRLIEQDSYFTIHRARQYGKTTMRVALWKRLKETGFCISFPIRRLTLGLPLESSRKRMASARSPI